MLINVYTMTSKKKNIMGTIMGLLRGALNWPVKIVFCKFWIYLHLHDVLFRYYHVRCLNILKFGPRFYFWGRKKFCALDQCIIFEWYFDHISPTILCCAQSRIDQCAHNSKCLGVSLQRIFDESYFT